jgi:hypothetical protein
MSRSFKELLADDWERESIFHSNLNLTLRGYPFLRLLGVTDEERKELTDLAIARLKTHNSGLLWINLIHYLNPDLKITKYIEPGFVKDAVAAYLNWDDEGRPRHE